MQHFTAALDALYAAHVAFDDIAHPSQFSALAGRYRAEDKPCFEPQPLECLMRALY